MRLIPRSLFSRLVLVMLAGLLVAQLLSFALHMHERGELLAQATGMQSAQRIADIVRLLDPMSAGERRKIIQVLSAPPLAVSLDRTPLDDRTSDAATGMHASMFGAMLRRYLADERPVAVAVSESSAWAPGPGMGWGKKLHSMPDGSSEWMPLMMRHAEGAGLSFVAQVRLQDGTLATFDSRAPSTTASWPYRLLLSIAVLLVAVILVSLIAVRWVTRPLNALADAADELGRNINRPAMLETGPLEVARAARAFNQMQSRLSGYLSERTRVLAAMSHDLKTPVTRLRLRAELLDDAQLRAKFTGDLQEMESMVSATLDFLRGMENSEPVRPVDIMALLESLQTDIQETGGTVAIDGQTSKPYPGRAQALKRGIGNLVENAVKYGQRAHVIVDDNDARLELRIKDEGPGIPPDELDKVFEPFYRVEASRNRDTGGTGLGLPIARGVAELHGGRLVLANRPGGGLEATLTLPRQSRDS
jgi:signal transduction histidine kinase